MVKKTKFQTDLKIYFNTYTLDVCDLEIQVTRLKHTTVLTKESC